MSQLTNYIEKELKKGFSKNLIREKLLHAGYTDQEITESFASIASSQPLLRRKLADEIYKDLHMQWAKWVFPLLAVGVLLFLGYLIFLYATGEKGGVQEKVVTDCDGITDVPQKDICYLQLAAEGEDVCSQIITPPIQVACMNKIWEDGDCTYETLLGEDRETCLFQRAVATKDSSYCYQKMDDIDCLVTLALETKEPTVCEGELFCYQRYALETQDSTVCEYLSNSYERDGCYDNYRERMQENQ